MTHEEYHGGQTTDLPPLHVRKLEAQGGLEALVERLNLEMDRLNFEEPVRANIDTVLQLGVAAHDGQLRDGRPYFDHVLRVGLRLVGRMEETDPDTIMAALLHDTVEDNPTKLMELLHYTGPPATNLAEAQTAALGCLESEFGPAVAGMVDALTNPPFNNPGDPKEYQEHVVQLLKSELVVQMPNGTVQIKYPGKIKLADFIDNSSGLQNAIDPGKKERLPGKYLPLFPAMRALARNSNLFSERAQRYIFKQLARAEGRCRRLVAQQEIGGIVMPKIPRPR